MRAKHEALFWFKNTPGFHICGLFLLIHNVDFVKIQTIHSLSAIHD